VWAVEWTPTPLYVSGSDMKTLSAVSLAIMERSKERAYPGVVQTSTPEGLEL
jgi:hypothetical protein